MCNYNNISKQYDDYGKQATTDWELGHKLVSQLLGNVKHKKILDYGCGTGKFSRYLSNLEANVVGIDISTSQLEIANQNKDKNVIYLQDNDLEIDNKYKKYFDSGVAIFLLCEISSHKDNVAVLKRINRLLKPNAKFIILNPNWDKSNGKKFLTHQMKYIPKLASGCKVTTILKTNPPIEVPDFYWSKQDYLNMLTVSGFGNFNIHEPVATNNKLDWKDEKKFPPFLIIESNKT